MLTSTGHTLGPWPRPPAMKVSRGSSWRRLSAYPIPRCVYDHDLLRLKCSCEQIWRQVMYVCICYTSHKTIIINIVLCHNIFSASIFWTCIKDISNWWMFQLERKHVKTSPNHRILPETIFGVQSRSMHNNSKWWLSLYQGVWQTWGIKPNTHSLTTRCLTPSVM